MPLICALLPIFFPYLVRCERKRVCLWASAHILYKKSKIQKKNTKTRKKPTNKNLLLLPNISVKQNPRQIWGDYSISTARFDFSRPEVNFNHRVLSDTANPSTIILYRTRFNWSFSRFLAVVCRLTVFEETVERTRARPSPLQPLGSLTPPRVFCSVFSGVVVLTALSTSVSLIGRTITLVVKGDESKRSELPDGVSICGWSPLGCDRGHVVREVQPSRAHSVDSGVQGHDDPSLSGLCLRELPAARWR